VTQPPAHVRKRGPNLWLSLAILLGGLVLAIVSWIQFARPFVHQFNDSPRITRTGPVVLHLDKGHYLVYDSLLLREVGAQVSITGPDGPISTRTPIPNETFSRGGHSYTGTIRFDVPRTGDYTFVFSGAGFTDVIVARTFGDTFHDAVPWLPSAIIGSLSFIAGIALLVIGIVRRHSRPGSTTYW
jgi:hypothetical protein